MSTLLAIIMAVIVAFVVPVGTSHLLPLVMDLFSASNTGGPFLYGMLASGVVGYSSFAAVYVGLRVFTRASREGVFWSFVCLSLLGQGANAWNLYRSEGGDGLITILGFAAATMFAAYLGAGIGAGLASADVEDRRREVTS